jgi:hypothetical protein
MIAYKHHVSQFFIDHPTAMYSANAVLIGATIFLDFGAMLDYLRRDGRKWHVCTLNVDRGDYNHDFINMNMVTLLVEKATSNFVPMEYAMGKNFVVKEVNGKSVASVEAYGGIQFEIEMLSVVKEHYLADGCTCGMIPMLQGGSIYVSDACNCPIHKGDLKARYYPCNVVKV